MNFRLDWTYDEDPELQLRLRPLREHWEARGPGMLRHLQKSFPWLSFPDQMKVQLVQPRKGGGGRVLSRTRIEFEAVLANRHPQLPEVLRLAWLVLCAASDAATESNEGIAFIPAILTAAEFVEMARCDESTIDLALDNWVETAPKTSTGSLYSWWEDKGRESCTKDRDDWLAYILR